jgi:hypothetical protein
MEVKVVRWHGPAAVERMIMEAIKRAAPAVDRNMSEA